MSNSNKMKAARLEAPRHFQLIDIERPLDLGREDARLRVHRVGICGTDISGYLGKMPYFSYPRIPGHELGVEVIEVGEAVSNVKPGDRCSVEPYLNCGRCYSCRRGHTNCCESNQTLGVMCDGGMTEEIILPARKLHPSAVLTYSQLALVETLAIGCHAANRGEVQSGENVLVIGAGPIGLSAIEFVKLAGANPIVMDINDARLAFVRNNMGVNHTILVEDGDKAVGELQQLTSGQLADVVIDATGNHESMGNALRYCAFRGRVVYVGITQSNITFPHAAIMHRRELDIRASRNAMPGDFIRIIRSIESGELDTRPWITHESTLDEMITRFPEWVRPECGVVKAMVSVLP